jgi:hypothetical protein
MKTSLIILMGVVAVANAHVGDVGVAILNNRLVTGVVEDLGSGDVVSPGARVFGAEIGLTVPGFGDEPGFFATNGTLAAGSGLGFNIISAVRKWDSTSGTFIAASEYMRLERPDGTVFVDSPLNDTFTPGWAFTVSAGDFDDHPYYYIQNRGDAGIYLLELTLYSTINTIATSESFWLVINDGADESDHDAAIAYTENVIVPTPATASLTLAGLVAFRRRR